MTFICDKNKEWIFVCQLSQVWEPSLTVSLPNPYLTSDSKFKLWAEHQINVEKITVCAHRAFLDLILCGRQHHHHLDRELK